MRLFVALDLDEEARAAIAGEQAKLRARADRQSLKWVRPEHLHMTLVFLGEIADARADGVAAAFREPETLAPFTVTFRGFGVFPPRGAPRALWLGVTEGQEPLRAVQRRLAERASRLEIPLERREFSPHLTLARWKDSRPADRARLLDAAPDRAVATVHVGHLTLYRSQLSSAGPTYTPLAHVTLAGRG